MRKTVWLGVVCVLGAAAINACGSDGGTAGSTEGSGDQGTGGHTTTHSSSSGTGGAMTSSSSSSSTSSSSSSSSSGATFNGCDPAKAEDHTADAMVTINFGGAAGLTYDPACIKIKTGTMVTFAGSFSSHPLSGGTSGTPDASSPITHTTTGMSATFTFANAGTFPYYCDLHFSSGMEGAVFVQ